MSRRSRLFVTTAVKDWGRSPLSRVPDTPFTPATLSPDLWLDASDTSTITESGGAVSQWNNKGSLGNFTQATGAVQPTTGATTLNGLNVIDFAADYLTATDTNEWKFLHDGTDYIVAVVWKAGITSDPNAFYMAFGNNANTSSKIGMFFAFDDRVSQTRNDRLFHAVSDGSSFVMSNITADDEFDANTFAISTILADPDNGTGADRSAIHRNAGSATTNNTATLSVSSSDPTHALQIGANGNSSNPLTGSIAEIVIVSGANATESNRTELRDYLNNKWAAY